MKKVKPLKDRSECERGALVDGVGIIPIILNNKLVLRWDDEFQIEGVDGTFILNDLAKQGKAHEVFSYEVHCIDLGYPKKMTEGRIKKIKKEFKEHGFKVSTDAIMHNFETWNSGFKCGYRDDANGYHLFTPCGGNPFSLTATSLDEKCDWQTTYWC